LAQSPRNRRNKIFEKIPPPSAVEGNSPSVPAVFQPVFLAKKSPLQPPNLKSPAALHFSALCGVWTRGWGRPSQMSRNDATFLSLFGNPDKLNELINALRR
jgi:hypothetical protein